MANPLDINKELGDLKKFNEELAKTAGLTSQLLGNSKKLTTELGKTKGLADQNKKRTAVQKNQNEVEKQGNKLLSQRNVLVAKQASALTPLRKSTIKQSEALKEQNRLMREQAKIDLGIKKRNGLFKSMTKSILAAGVAMVGFRTVLNVFKNSLKTIVDFEEAMSKVRAVTGALPKQFKQLTDNAKLLGGTTSKTATEVAGLQLEFSKLGFSTQEILNATEATISLSIAAGSDLAESAVVAASTIRGFGLDARETQRVVDVMAKSFSSSALDLEKFKVSMAIAAPISKAFGKDIEFTTARLSVLADAGLDASTSGTSLRNIFLELSKRGLTWEEGLAKINTSTNKNVTALELFGKRGATAALILADNTEKAIKLEEAYDGASGSAKEMARIMEDNVRGELKELSSAWEKFVLNIETGTASISRNLRKIIVGLKNVLNTISDDAILEKFGLDRKLFQDSEKVGRGFIKLYNDLNRSINDVIINADEINDFDEAIKELSKTQSFFTKDTDIERAKFQLYGEIIEKLKDAKTAFYESQAVEAQKASIQEQNALDVAKEAALERLRIIGERARVLDSSLESEDDFFDGILLLQKKDLEEKKRVAKEKEAVELEFSEFLANMVDEREQKNKDAADKEIEEAERVAEAKIELNRQIRDSAISAAQETGNILFDLGKAQRDRELEGLEEGSERRKELLREQAQAERNQALFNAAINTASGIIKTISNVGLPAAFPLLAIQAALGATQIAAIASQPIPEFFKGTESAPGGLAWIAERGAELLNMPDGSSILAEDKALMNVPKGTQVKTAEQTQEILNKAIYNDIALNSNEGIENRLDSVLNAIKNQPKEVTMFDDNGIKRYLQQGNSKTNYLNRKGRK